MERNRITAPSIEQIAGQPVIEQANLVGWQSVLAPYGVGYRIKLLSQLMARKFQERLDPLGLTLFHWVVLCCLWEEDGLAISSIGERLKQVGGTMTGVLDRMEKRGLVKREPDLQDRRVWRIWLTPDGRDLQNILPPIAAEIREQAMTGLSISEREQLLSLVNQAITNLS